ncbi:glycoside hydrolase superfamily [Aspergillus californicus]
MKQFTLLAVLLPSLLVAALPRDVPHSVEGKDTAVDEGAPDVTVWVHHGQTLSVEPNHPTTTVDQEPTGDFSILPFPEIPGSTDIVPNLAADASIKVNANTKEVRHDTRAFGISYSPYNADSTCKNDAEVQSDIDKLTHYAYVRIYGIDCDQTRKVVKAARVHNLQVFAGVYDLANLHASLDVILTATRGDYSILHTISIGNELLNRGAGTVGAVTAAVGDARAYLRSRGYGGPVVTVDTFNQLFAHPELCQVSDYCAANCHAFFDANLTPGNAGNYVRDIARQLSAQAGGKLTIITETGWPHAGQPNGHAVPSPENHHRAIEALRQNFWGDNRNLVLFSAFDDYWKVDTEWTFGAEKFWGIEKR